MYIFSIYTVLVNNSTTASKAAWAEHLSRDVRGINKDLDKTPISF